ncbi:MAG: hypothetical protein BGN88_01220 [Clostridiales bacterium 43-6]|nr:MAG: hypothetical protein BGN88_01220 [Clostridiales bacterium 43-6]
MIMYETRYGKVTISNEFFAKLIGNAVSQCYGVAGMVAKGTQWWRTILTRKHYPDTGIQISGDINSVCVDLHITVIYGLNINAIADSIVGKVKYTVEDATGIIVDKVNVHIDGMKAE